MKLGEFMSRAKEQIPQGMAVALFTDRYNVYLLDELEKEVEAAGDKVLEIRIFSEERELKLFRTDIGREFVFRDSKDLDGYDTYKETQFLDIDTVASAKYVAAKQVVSTGGGKYKLPLEKINDAKVEILYYISNYPESGQARIADYRIVKFVEGK